MMRNKGKVSLALGLSLLLVHLPILGTNVPLGKVIPRAGSTLLNGADLKLETTLYGGDTVATKRLGVALIQLSQGDQVHMAPETSVALSGDEAQLVVSLQQGITFVRSGNARQIFVNALGLLVRPSGVATYHVAIDGEAVVVASQEGEIEVQGINRSMMVPSGRAMRFELTAAPQQPVGGGSGAQSISGGAGAAIGAAIGVGVAIGIVLPIALSEIDDVQDDLDEICQQAQTLSPSSTVAQSCAAAGVP